MAKANQTTVTEFAFVSFTRIPELKIGLLFLFSLLYIFILMGNVSIIILVPSNRHLHTPMYFFLTNLSFFDFCYASTVVPKMLANFLVRNPTISVIGCSLQMFFYVTLGGTDCYLLAVMAFDRYVAICNPLRYSTIMSTCLCIKFLASCFCLSAIISLHLVILISRLPFCGNNCIKHFFCEIPMVLTLACTDTSVYEVVVFIAGVLLLAVPFLLIIISYGFIISSVMRITSSQGRSKAFSTCTSHLSVVLLQYGVVIFMYMLPKSMHSPDKDRLVSLVYVLGTPLLNPLIYTLRNKDMKAALKKVFLKQKGLH